MWQVILHADQAKGGSGEPPKTFTFDQVYDDTSQQEVTRPRIAPALLSRDRTRERGCRTHSARCGLRAALHAALHRSTARGVRPSGWQVLYQETAARIVDSVLAAGLQP